MPTWRVRFDGKVRELDEDRLRKRLRSGSLTGRELVWRESDGAWVPLRELPLFAEVVPFAGDALDASRRREAVGLAIHVVAYAVLAAVVGYRDGGAGIVVLLTMWGAGVAFHAASAWPAVHGLFVKEPPADDGPVRRQLVEVPPVPPIRTPDQIAAALGAPRALASADPWAQQLDEALRALKVGFDELRRDDPIRTDLPDLDALRRTALQLHERTRALAPVCEPAVRASIEEASVGAREGSSSADPATAAAYRAEAAAAAERLAVIDETSQLLVQLEARQRGLLHQVEAFRLTLLRREPGDHAVDLAEAIRRMRGLADAEREVEDLLARIQPPSRE